MAKHLQLIRYPTAVSDTYKGPDGEITVDTSKRTAVIHDNAKTGGYPLAREDASNIPAASGTNDGKMTIAQAVQLVTNTADIAQNQADIAQNQADIAQNSADIAQNVLDIAGLANVKADKVVPSADVNVAVLDGVTGNLEDGGKTVAELLDRANHTGTDDLTSDVSGILPVANGGTGQSSVAAVQAAFNIVQPIRDSVRGLVVTRPGSNTITLTASEVILQSAAGFSLRRSAISHVAVDLSVAATGTTSGLDTGTITNDTWYYVWLAWDGTNEVLLLSTSSLTPSTSRFNWTYAARLCTVRRGSGTFIDFQKRGNVISLITQRLIQSGSFSTTPWTAINIASFYPPVARTISGWFGASASFELGVSPFSNGNGGVISLHTFVSASRNFNGLVVGRQNYIAWRILYPGTSIYYYTGVSGSTMYATGWEE